MFDAQHRRGGGEHGRAHPLGRSRDQQHLQPRGKAAGERAEREHHEPDGEDSLQRPAVGNLAKDEDQARQDHQIDGHYPGGGPGISAEVFANDWEGNIHYRTVQSIHEHC